MRRGLAVVVAVVLGLGMTVGALAAEKTYGILVPSKIGEKSEVIYLSADEWAALRGAPKGLDKVSGTTGIIDTIYTDEGLSGVNFGFASNDTFAAYFKPPAAMIVKAIGFNAHSWSTGVPVSDGVNVSLRWALGYHADYPPDSVDGAGWIGYWENGQWIHNDFAPQPPVGSMFWGDMPWTVDEENIEEVPTSYLGVEPDVGRQDFFVIIVPYGGEEGAYVGFDAGDAGSNFYARGFKYYQGQGTSGRPGWHIRHYGWWTYCVVEFYENTPPAITGLTQIASTYDPNKEFKARCEITDIDAANPANAGVAEAYLVWSTGTTVDSAAMTNVEGNIWEGQITGVGVGEVEYWVGAKDKGGLYAKSSSKRFVIAQPENPNADLLLCFQGALNPGWFEWACENLGYKYEVWDIDANYGIDESITGYGWSTIFVVGWGASSVPTREYEGNPYATFLTNGGNLFLSDMDYFYGNGEPGAPTFEEGTFAYDFFGIAGGENDPGANLDSVFVGVAGDPISGDFVEDPLRMTWWAYAGYRDYNWTDYLTPGAATTILKNEAGDKIVGVRYEGTGFKTVHVSFMADCLGDSVPSPQLQKLVENVLNWFGTGTGVASEGKNVPVEYSLSQNYPNPFNPTTTIEYSLAKAGEVTLSVYNMLGQKVATLVDGYKQAGRHKVTFDASGLPSGVYFYKLEAGDYQAIHKMVLTK